MEFDVELELGHLLGIIRRIEDEWWYKSLLKKLKFVLNSIDRGLFLAPFILKQFPIWQDTLQSLLSLPWAATALPYVLFIIAAFRVVKLIDDLMTQILSVQDSWEQLPNAATIDSVQLKETLEKIWHFARHLINIVFNITFTILLHSALQGSIVGMPLIGVALMVFLLHKKKLDWFKQVVSSFESGRELFQKRADQKASAKDVWLFLMNFGITLLKSTTLILLTLPDSVAAQTLQKFIQIPEVDFFTNTILCFDFFVVQLLLPICAGVLELIQSAIEHLKKRYQLIPDAQSSAQMSFSSPFSQ